MKEHATGIASIATSARWWLPAIVAIPYLWFAVNNYHYELDDALIYMRYLQNLLDGNGLVYNPGERFDGLTSPLFSYLTAAIAVIFRNVQFATWLASTACTYAAMVVFFLIFWDQTGTTTALPRAAAALGLLIGAATPFFFSTYGMETGLFVLLCGLTLRSYLARDWSGFVILSTLLVLTRPEGLALAGAAGLHHLITARTLPPLRPKPIALALGLAVAIVAANLYFFHEPWAETGAAKIWQGRSGYWGDGLAFLNVSYLLDSAFAGSPVSAWILISASVLGIVALGISELNIVALLFLSSYGAFYTLLNIPNYHWYYSAYFIFLPFYAASGALYLAGTLVRGDATRRSRLIATTVVGAVAYPVLAFVAADAGANDSREAPYARIGRWIAANTPATSSFAASEIGALGWYSQRKVIDILGLVNAGNARLIGERNFDGWVSLYHPDYLLVHDPANELELAYYTFAARYSLIQRCDLPVAGYAFYRIAYEAAASTFCRPGDELKHALVATSAGHGAVDAGHIDVVSVLGNFVRIDGWATNGGSTPYQELLVAAGHDVDFGVYRRVSRADVARNLKTASDDRFGFELMLRFPSDAQARQWVTDGCLMAARANRAAPLHDTCKNRFPFADDFD